MIKNTKNYKKIFEGGFSLVEMLVAVGIFMSIMTLAVSSLISIIGANKKVQATKSTVDSVTFATEYISETMRMGTNYECSVNGQDFSPICIGGGKAVRFKFPDSIGALSTLTYSFNNGTLTKSKSGCSSCTVDLISKDSRVDITDMKFYLINTGQPRVIITTSGKISVKGSETTFNLQTGISQRTRY